jgi:hypothetical protein
MTAHSELLARLEGASEGSRELDALVFRAFGEPLPTEFAEHGIRLTWQPDGKATMPLGDLQVAYTPPAYSTSIDAALALAERVRVAPYTGPITLAIAGSGQAYIDHIDPCGMCVQAYASTPALALCIAILRAKEHQPSEDGEKT